MGFLKILLLKDLKNIDRVAYNVVIKPAGHCARARARAARTSPPVKPHDWNFELIPFA